ncbi:MAG: UDP-N-acetylmuramoyl-tripeptide--D-alanyl-D-alanine ligase [Patescibacteria group bacterium]|nr:UDP-N-acetylmuramoyl-tripeptide--D-alanyl-D-alanine ligase [Patescibacteria group bacterium]
MADYQPKGIKKLYHQTRRIIAKKWLSFFRPLQIGITGSQGKTSITQTLAKILKDAGSTVVTDVNLDTNFNVPITALKVRPWTKYVVWELGVDHIGEMDNHLDIAKPTIGIVSGISTVHTDREHLGSVKNVIREKRKLIESLPSKETGGVAILNWDDQNVREMALFTQAKVIFYGESREMCQFLIDPKTAKITLEGTSFSITYYGKKYFFQTKLLGLHHQRNFAAIFAVLVSIFRNPKKAYQLIVNSLKEIRPLKGRMSLELGPRKTLILNDSLRANPTSTDEGLKTFYSFPYQGRKIAIIGVMGELCHPIKDHRKTAETIIKYPPDIIIGVGHYRKYTINELKKVASFKEKVFFAKNVVEAAKILDKMIKPGDFLYIKGSLLRNLWRIVKILKKEPICCTNDLCVYQKCQFN